MRLILTLLLICFSMSGFSQGADKPLKVILDPNVTLSESLGGESAHGNAYMKATIADASLEIASYEIVRLMVRNDADGSVLNYSSRNGAPESVAQYLEFFKTYLSAAIKIELNPESSVAAEYPETVTFQLRF